MTTVHSTRTAYFDVDGTLVCWEFPVDESQNLVEFKAGYFTEWLLPHREHIVSLKRHKLRGDAVIVWSQRGADWAECVVKALGLEAYVDVCQQKPTVYYDDLPVTAYMGPPIYFKQKDCA